MTVDTRNMSSKELKAHSAKCIQLAMLKDKHYNLLMKYNDMLNQQEDLYKEIDKNKIQMKEINRQIKCLEEDVSGSIDEPDVIIDWESLKYGKEHATKEFKQFKDALGYKFEEFKIAEELADAIKTQFGQSEYSYNGYDVCSLRKYLNQIKKFIFYDVEPKTNIPNKFIQFLVLNIDKVK